MATKNQSSHNIAQALRELLHEGLVGTQEEICAALSAQGHAVSQSKISRLLLQIGAIKIKNQRQQIVYRLPQEPTPPTTNSSLLSLVGNIAANESLIVVRTSPGSASLIARMLDFDQAKTTAILGTLAGDDTIVVIPKSIAQIDLALREVRSLLGVKSS